MATSTAALQPYTKGTRAWFPDKDEGFVSATLESSQITDDKVTLNFIDDNGAALSFTSSITDLEKENFTALPPLRNPPMLESTEDLTNLSYLNEPAVLNSIRTRYTNRAQIYTYSGIVLVAVNPFSAVPLYGNELVQAYAGKRKGELEPHLFAIAEEAYRCMIRDNKNQTIIVSGESGAGKTVSAKYIMRYFATVDDPDKPGKRKTKDKEGMSEVERQILATNPIMEAFGNAKTTRNDNSSRFGKYIEILFDNTQTIIGARIRTYLLERSRLVYQPETERNYHIFYQLLAGCPSSDLKSIGLDDASNFFYMNQGGAAARVIPGLDDAEELKVTEKALDTVGITSSTRWKIFQLLGALLHIGNVEIKQTRSDAYISEDDPHVKYVVDLLGIDASEYKKWTVKKQITTRSEKIVTALTSAQAIVVRDSVAKYIYACLFDWLVSIVNDSLAKDRGEVASFIGVLDIYGFEHFKKNSFEQFCINYANEQLQQEFNAHVFKLEQEEYKAEQINWKYIDFSDNQPTIDLIEGKLGIIALLDEESRLPSGSDQTLIQKLHTELGKPQHAKIFKKPRFGQSAFTIAHYAHDVTYEIDGFLEKNRDTVPDEHLAMLNATTNPFLKEVLDRAAASHQTPSVGTPKDPGTPNEVAKPGRKGPGASARKPTLGSIFKASLIQLKETIDSTNAHYIRCIKPNEAKAAWEFDPPLVLSQLKACGVLETIRISCAGYPTRWTFEEFAERYYMLTPSANWGPDLRNLCTLILDASIKDEDKYQIGLTKIFFRAGMLAYMETVRTDRLNYLVTLMQKRALAHYHQTRYQRLRRTTVGIQSMWRRILARREADRRRKEGAALDIQKAVRGFLQRKQYLRTRQAVITLQAALRGRKVRLLYLEQKKEMAAVKLQSFWRGRSVRNQYIKDRSDIAKVQACVRRHQARTQLKTLRVAARSASHFKEVSYKLENKVVELTQALQRRTAENKEQQAIIKALEVSIQSWVVKFEDAEKKSREELDLQKKSSVPLPEFESLSTQKREVDEKLEESMKKITDQDAQIEKLMAEFATQTDELEARQKQLSGASTNGDEGQTVGSLRAELATLREQLRGVSGAKQSMSAHQRGDPAFSTTLGKSHENGTPLVGAAALQATPGKRRNRRGSVPQIYPSDSTMSTLPPYDEFQPKSYSMAGSGYPNDTLKRLAAEEDLDPEAIADEIIRLLEEEKPLDEDVLGSLITSLRIPPPSSTTPPVPKEVLFPAHLISLITNEMWKYGMLKESERFLANVMQTIQQHVMSFTGEDSIIPGIFWLSNVHEILSFVCIAESDILQGIGPGAEGMGRDFDWDEYEHLVTIVKHDLDSLEYNIYHTWMSEAKKLLGKMAVPALVEYQALPGFLSNEGAPKLFNRLLHGNTTPAFNTDDILSLLNKIHKALKSYYVEATVIQQVVTELLKLIGVQSFNELLMRRNFCSWKRAMQIQYNITRIEEWCQSKDMPEGTLQLEHLMQATKLLQLKKASTHDIEIICDVCWMLTPTQIQKLISNYAVADYETPISPEVLKAVASRVMANDRNDHLLLPPEGEDVGPYDTPLPRHIEDLYTYVPAWLSVPHLRKVTAYLDA